MALAATSTVNAVEVNGEASVNVLTALQVNSLGTNLDFGDMAAGAVDPTVITIDSAALANRTLQSGDGTLFATNPGTSAGFQIVGETGLVVDISVTDNGDINTAAGITFAPFPPSLGPTHTIQAIAIDNQFYVGGTISVPALTPSGTYTNPNAYIVTVNYQ